MHRMTRTSFLVSLSAPWARSRRTQSAWPFAVALISTEFPSCVGGIHAPQHQAQNFAQKCKNNSWKRFATIGLVRSWFLCLPRSPTVDARSQRGHSRLHRSRPCLLPGHFTATGLEQMRNETHASLQKPGRRNMRMNRMNLRIDSSLMGKYEIRSGRRLYPTCPAQ